MTTINITSGNVVTAPAAPIEGSENAVMDRKLSVIQTKQVGKAPTQIPLVSQVGADFEVERPIPLSSQIALTENAWKHGDDRMRVAIVDDVIDEMVDVAVENVHFPEEIAASYEQGRNGLKREYKETSSSFERLCELLALAVTLIGDAVGNKNKMASETAIMASKLVEASGKKMIAAAFDQLGGAIGSFVASGTALAAGVAMQRSATNTNIKNVKTNVKEAQEYQNSARHIERTLSGPRMPQDRRINELKTTSGQTQLVESGSSTQLTPAERDLLARRSDDNYKRAGELEQKSQIVQQKAQATSMGAQVAITSANSIGAVAQTSAGVSAAGKNADAQMLESNSQLLLGLQAAIQQSEGRGEELVRLLMAKIETLLTTEQTAVLNALKG
ncbi:hypothetical protein ACGTRS_31770 [Burkholderia semiarida]|uniref:Effector protein BipC n=1 Tax=Burkholderia semiarida TaxID=2843303 RepID=A0ABW7LFM2_9BURK